MDSRHARRRKEKGMLRWGLWGGLVTSLILALVLYLVSLMSHDWM